MRTALWIAAIVVVPLGAVSKQWWTELSAAIAGGLVVATALTLIVTTAKLILGVRRDQRSKISEGIAKTAQHA